MLPITCYKSELVAFVKAGKWPVENQQNLLFCVLKGDKEVNKVAYY